MIRFGVITEKDLKDFIPFAENELTQNDKNSGAFSGLAMGGFACSDLSLDINGIYGAEARQVERVIGLHFINAVRVAFGKNPVEYNHCFDGEGMTFTGYINGTYYENHGFGAQYHIELYKQGKVGAHQDVDKRGFMSAYYSGIMYSGETVGDSNHACGEECIKEYCYPHTSESGGAGAHMRIVLNESQTCVGIGFSGGYHMEDFGAETLSQSQMDLIYAAP